MSSEPFNTNSVITKDLTVNNQANFRKNIYCGLDLTVANTMRVNGTTQLNGSLILNNNEAISTLNQNCTYVSKQGDDSTGVRNDTFKPFLTIAAAVAASQAGDLICVLPGVYDEFNLVDGFPAPVNLDFYFHPGAIVQPTGTTVSGNPGTAPIFLLDRPGTIRIFGQGEFINIGNGDTDTCAFTTCVDTSARIEAECKRVSSVQAWGNGIVSATVPTVIVKNAIIDWIVSVYGTAIVDFENCKFINTGPVGLDFDARVTTFRARNCTFYRDQVNTDYFTQSTGATTNIPKQEPPAQGALFHMNTKQRRSGAPNSDNFSCEFYNCIFINRFQGTTANDAGHGIWFNNYDNTTGSQLVLDNCRFDLTDTNGAAVYYTRIPGAGTSSANPIQAGGTPETKSFISNCVTNKDLVLETVPVTATNSNELSSGFEVSAIFRMEDRLC